MLCLTPPSQVKPNHDGSGFRRVGCARGQHSSQDSPSPLPPGVRTRLRFNVFNRRQAGAKHSKGRVSPSVPLMKAHLAHSVTGNPSLSLRCSQDADVPGGPESLTFRERQRLFSQGHEVSSKVKASRRLTELENELNTK